jgi:hypothetical protein
MAEQLRQGLPVRQRQWRGRYRGDVFPQMLRIARAEQHDIDTRLVPREAVGGIGDRARTPLVDQKAERVRRVGKPARQLTARGSFAQCCGEALGLREDVAHYEHQQCANAICHRQRKHLGAGILVYHVERDHDRIPNAVLHRAADHLVLRIDELGHSKKSDLTLLSFLQERGRDDVSRLVVDSRRNAV